MNVQEPSEPLPEECCGEGCASCVWDIYRDKLQKWEEARKIVIPGAQRAGISKVHFTRCILKLILPQTKDTNIYRFEFADQGQNPLFRPGQHLEMRGYCPTDGKEIIRKYSPISSSINGFEVVIKLYKTGKMSAFVKTLQEGNEVDWRGPYGNFTYNRGDQELLLLLCAGTGLAPMIPIIRSIVEDSEDETRVCALCCCHSLESRLLLTELKELSSYWNFSFVHHVISEEGKPGWGEVVEWERLNSKYVIRAMKDTPVKKCRVLVCGSDSFCLDMKTIIVNIGAPYHCF